MACAPVEQARDDGMVRVLETETDGDIAGSQID